MSQVTQQVEQLALPIVNECDLELVDVVYEKEGSNWFLRVYIDKDGGVDIEECGQVSERLSAVLDEVDPIKEAYFLEVSSPGVERPLKKKTDFEKNIGQHIYVKLYEPIEKQKEFTGDLVAFKDDVATINYKEKTKSKEVDVPFAKIAKARLAVTF
ncbi:MULTISPECIES: ribosome maturation factor RimP [Gracilibacillus]|uniref:ribosome maturation factor RimP n=1 Tax=Gracilibacillus TaxID=74385 RepID=UPI0008242A23|nr:MULTISPECIES: ribosome maturation factor RimP [Gracilibacillus]